MGWLNAYFKISSDERELICTMFYQHFKICISIYH